VPGLALVVGRVADDADVAGREGIAAENDDDVAVFGEDLQAVRRQDLGRAHVVDHALGAPSQATVRRLAILDLGDEAGGLIEVAECGVDRAGRGREALGGTAGRRVVAAARRK
jgi:hypothetical protein